MNFVFIGAGVLLVLADRVLEGSKLALYCRVEWVFSARSLGFILARANHSNLSRVFHTRIINGRARIWWKPTVPRHELLARTHCIQDTLMGTDVSFVCSHLSEYLVDYWSIKTGRTRWKFLPRFCILSVELCVYHWCSGCYPSFR